MLQGLLLLWWFIWLFCWVQELVKIQQLFVVLLLLCSKVKFGNCLLVLVRIMLLVGLIRLFRVLLLNFWVSLFGFGLLGLRQDQLRLRIGLGKVLLFLWYILCRWWNSLVMMVMFGCVWFGGLVFFQCYCNQWLLLMIELFFLVKQEVGRWNIVVLMLVVLMLLYLLMLCQNFEVLVISGFIIIIYFRCVSVVLILVLLGNEVMGLKFWQK